MDPIHKKMNKEIVQLIEQLDTDPDSERPTTFWFFSQKEKNIYCLANHLQELNMKIEYCGRTVGENNKYLLIAEKWMCPSCESMDNLWAYFNEISQRFDVVYDGWETMLVSKDNRTRNNDC